MRGSPCRNSQQFLLNLSSSVHHINLIAVVLARLKPACKPLPSLRVALAAVPQLSSI